LPEGRRPSGLPAKGILSLWNPIIGDIDEHEACHSFEWHAFYLYTISSAPIVEGCRGNHSPCRGFRGGAPDVLVLSKRKGVPGVYRDIRLRRIGASPFIKGTLDGGMRP